MTYALPSRDVGATYFFTVRLQDRSADTLVHYVDVLRQAVRIARKRHPFEISAAVVLPATLHMMWRLPIGDDDYACRWRIIKSTFSRHVPAPETRVLTESMKRRREKGIWQRGYWAHQIRDQTDYDLHEHLITHAPVSAGLVSQPKDWTLSSVHVRRSLSLGKSVQPYVDLAKPQRFGATLF